MKKQNIPRAALAMVLVLCLLVPGFAAAADEPQQADPLTARESPEAQQPSPEPGQQPAEAAQQPMAGEIGVTIDTPNSAPGLTATETVSITLSSAAHSFSGTDLTLTVDGTFVDMENTMASVVIGSPTPYTFTATANLSAPGSHTIRVDASASGGVLTGTATKTVTNLSGQTGIYGVVTGVNGAPLAGVNVYLLHSDGGHTGTVTTDANGGYSITSVGQGGYGIGVNAGTYGGTAYTGYRSSVEILTGKLVERNIALTPAAPVTGVVTGSGGAPLSGVPVSLTDGSGNTLYGPAQSGADGTYRITDAPAGSYTLTVPTGTYGGTTYGAYTQPVVVPDTGLTQNISLIPAASVSGVVTGAGGAQLQGVRVILSTENGMQYMYTGADGGYRFEGVAPGTHTLSANAGIASGMLYEVYVQEITVPDAGLVRNIALTPLVSVSGVVTGTGGAPLSGVQVRLVYPAGNYVVAITGADGSYSFSNVDPGSYVLTASAAGYRLYSQEITVPVAGLAQNIALAPTAYSGSLTSGVGADGITDGTGNVVITFPDASLADVTGARLALGGGTGRFSDFVLDGGVLNISGGNLGTVGVAGECGMGSVIVTLYSSYLQTLPDGDYTFTLQLTDGEGSVDFTLKKAAATAASATSPKTGDSTGVELWAILVGIACCALLLAAHGRRGRVK